MAERASAKTKKKKREKIMQECMRKKSKRSEKLCISIKRTKMFLYTRKNDFSLELNTAII